MPDLSTLFGALPATLRAELIDCHREIITNYSERRWGPTELNGGKFCEVVYTILDGALSSTFARGASKPSNMVNACRSLESLPADPTRVGDRSLRVLIPRLLPFLYEIRNNRGVGHVGGEVDPNREDAEAVVSMTNWVMAELIRIFHNVSISDAQDAVDLLVEKRHPLVWDIDGKRRVLNPNMKKPAQTLVLLYSRPGWTDVRTLSGWVEYSSFSQFKSKILTPLHKTRMIEYDWENARAQITPRGAQFVESKLLRR